jgi:hypothetical protein
MTKTLEVSEFGPIIHVRIVNENTTLDFAVGALVTDLVKPRVVLPSVAWGEDSFLFMAEATKEAFAMWKEHFGRATP